MVDDEPGNRMRALMSRFSLRLGRRKRSYKNEKATQNGFQSINSIGRMFTSNG
jgi:hypothetical protein